MTTDDQAQEQLQLVHLQPAADVRRIEALMLERQLWPENHGRTVARAEVLREIVAAGLPRVEDRQRQRAEQLAAEPSTRRSPAGRKRDN